jgi:hypothetical protein
MVRTVSRHLEFIAVRSEWGSPQSKQCDCGGEIGPGLRRESICVQIEVCNSNTDAGSL